MLSFMYAKKYIKYSILHISDSSLSSRNEYKKAKLIFKYNRAENQHTNNVGKGGTVASWLVGSSLDRAVWVTALVGDILLYTWARQFIVTVPPGV